MKALKDHLCRFRPCCVCGKRAAYVHEGRFYCVANDCQLVAAGMRTP